MLDLSVTGAEDLARVATALKQVGDNGLRKELLRGLRRATKPLKVAAREGALKRLPARGGLNVLVARSRLSIKTKTGSQSAGIQLVGTSPGHDLRAMDRGRLRHPVYKRKGRRAPWVNQAIEPGYWSKELDKTVPQIRRDVVKAMDVVARKAVGRG